MNGGIMKLKIRSLVLQLVAVCIFLAGASNAQAWGVKELETEKVAVGLVKEVERGGYKIVATADLKKMIDDKKAMLVIDTMPYEGSYKKNHIPGAVQFELPIAEMKSIEPAKKAELEKLLGADKNRLLVFYCGFTKCTRSHNGAMWAVKLGYKNVYRHPGGINAWKEAEYPVSSVK
jgi:rhodanese-related sulfurtransferase